MDLHQSVPGQDTVLGSLHSFIWASKEALDQAGPQQQINKTGI